MKGTAVRSISRAFEILELFRVERRPLSLKAVVDHFGYPLVSTADILKSLLHLGYLGFDVKSKTYLPAPRLFELSAWMAEDLLDPFDLIKDLQEFHQKTGLTLLLATTNDVELLTIVCLKSNQLKYGRERRCLFNSGTGLALVSSMDNEIAERMYRLSVARGLVEKTELPMEEMIAQLREIRAKGYIASNNCVGDGLLVVAMPLPVLYCNRRLALGCAGPIDEIGDQVNDVVDQMRAFIDTRWGNHQPEDRTAMQELALHSDFGFASTRQQSLPR